MMEMSAGLDQRNIWKVAKVVFENYDIFSVYLEGWDEKFAAGEGQASFYLS